MKLVLNVQLQNNFNYYLGGFSGFVSPVVSPTTSTTSGLTIGNPYVITVLGTTTAAEWAAIGLPAGLTAAVGQSFIATATGTGGSHTGKVGIPSVSGISSIEVVGDPNKSIASANIAQNGGAWLMLQCLGATSASVTTQIAKAPVDESVIGLCMRFDGSSVTIDGI